MSIATFICNTNTCDSSFNSGADFVWNNTSLREIVGNDVFDAYDLYNIECTSTIMIPATFGTNTSQRQLYCAIGGLNFQNSLYDIGTNQKIDPIMFYFSFSTTNGVISNFSHMNSATFLATDFFNFRVSYRAIFASLPVSPIPDTMLTFLIYPVRQRVKIPMQIEDNKKDKKEIIRKKSL